MKVFLMYSTPKKISKPAKAGKEKSADIDNPSKEGSSGGGMGGMIGEGQANEGPSGGMKGEK